ncbi:MAG TPA: hypothetical protein VFG74_12905 [Miltoncostaeaceae bacterium]|jgi:hypothetical protein|nr:hypothetical protein [Miltoncostaeaceae bacterium]
MRSPSSTHGQLILFPGVSGAAAPAPGPAARRRRPTRVERKVAELERIAEAAEREMSDSFRRGDPISAKAAHDRARGARRAAEILRAGPSGVAGVIGGHHEAA